jgi:hypothetical protein
MRDIKFSLMWTDGKTWMDLRYTLAEMENGDHWEAMSDMPILRKFVLKHRRQFTGLQDSKGVDIYEGDEVFDHNGEGFVEYVVDAGAFRVNYYGNTLTKWLMDYNLRGEKESIEITGNIHEANNNGAR